MWKRVVRKEDAMRWRRKQRDQDLERELRSDLELEAEEQRARGLSPEEARQAARRALGNATLIQENVRAMWGGTTFDTFLQDIRYGLRQLRLKPAFTTVAVLTLALGIGANTAIFSVVYAVLLRPLQFRDPSRLVQLFESESAPGNYPLSGPNYLDWQAQARTVQGMALFSWPHTMSAAGASEPQAAAVVNTQSNFFDVLGVQPFAGRTFAPGEDAAGNNHVAILSYGFWQRRLGLADVIGTTLNLNGEPYTVVGIMPRWFNLPNATEVWTPMDMSPGALGDRGNHNWAAVARLKEGITLDQARAELRGISERLEKQHPDTNSSVHALVFPLRDRLVGNSRTPLLVLLGAVTLLLFIACANVANLLLARATTRHREMALRAALGASRQRLTRQLLTESILLALAGAGLGTAGAWWCVRAIQSAKSLPIPRANPIELDASVLVFTIALSVLTGILFGLAPALQVSRRGPGEELKAAGPAVVGPGGRQLMRDALVVCEIAITLTLLVGGGLLLRTFAHLRSADIGVDTQNVLTMSVNLPEAKYGTFALRRQFFDELVTRASRTPGIEQAAISTEIPIEGGNNGYINVEGAGDPALSRQLVGWNYVTPEYFRVFRIPLLKGRTFTAADQDRTAATTLKVYELYRAAKGRPFKVPAELRLDAVVSRSMAQTFWRNQDPIGRTFRKDSIQITVIGVVEDVKEYGIRGRGIPIAYFPMTLALPDRGYARLTVKTRLPPSTLVPAIRNHVRTMDNTLAVMRVRTMEEVIAGGMQDASMQAFLLGIFAALALVLAAVGLYGVTSYLITQRTREIGIRMALGARQADVLRLILKHGTKLTLLGVALGVVAAISLTRLISGLLYGVTAGDKLTFVSVSVLLLLIALAAYYIPARRASRIDPMVALRYE
jgi:putative ABC transport system permease protein